MANWSKAQNADAKNIWTGAGVERAWGKPWDEWADYYELTQAERDELQYGRRGSTSAFQGL